MDFEALFVWNAAEAFSFQSVDIREKFLKILKK
jgi:hypothetical protein